MTTKDYQEAARRAHLYLIRGYSAERIATITGLPVDDARRLKQ